MFNFERNNFSPEYIVKSIKQKGENIIESSCFFYNGTGPLFRIKRRMDAKHCTSKQKDIMMPYAKYKKFRFMEKILSEKSRNPVVISNYPSFLSMVIRIDFVRSSEACQIEDNIGFIYEVSKAKCSRRRG